ncbi:hypothetical protein GCM10010178_59740 [Lentzea flava]|uniref:Uncharacterized protein n=2 Tax=Lentzea flava TaxID=103732 RepID=A0ABQ2V046_9PSEU|nr:hypothetical protein GCM10010178_59740 [Lentzea flava]
MMEQTDFLLPDGELDLLRRIRQLAERAERTAHNRSNLVGPPPSQEHLDILAEIRKLTEEMSVSRRAEALPRPARPADDLVGERW